MRLAKGTWVVARGFAYLLVFVALLGVVAGVLGGLAAMLAIYAVS